MAFEAILSRPDAGPKRWRRLTLTVSLVLHGLALTAGGIHSVWQVEEMPMPAIRVTLAAEAPPPPPPPPPARKSSSTKPKTKKTVSKPDAIVEPPEDPSKVVQQEEPEEEEQEVEGVEGGVEGGVPGGVPAVREAPPPPPPPKKPEGPAMVAPQVAAKLLAIDPNSPRYRPKMSKELKESGKTYVAVLRVCADAKGHVTSVSLLRGAHPSLDSQLPTVIGRWRYRPFKINGQKSPFCTNLRYEISAQ